VGTHKGGYDEFAFGITEAVQHLHSADKNGSAAIAVLWDNSPDRDRVPSDQSGFGLYGDFQVGKRQNIDSCSCSNSRTIS